MRAPRALKRNYVPRKVCCWDASPKSAEAQLRTKKGMLLGPGPKSAEAQLRTKKGMLLGCEPQER